MNGAILLSAWSAATSDIYVSSRFLFLLARRGHAPQFLAHLVRYPWYETRPAENTEDEDTDDDYEDVILIERRSPIIIDESEMDITESHRGNSLPEEQNKNNGVGLLYSTNRRPSSRNGKVGELPHEEKKPWLVLPLAAVLVSSSVGFLGFLTTSGPDSGTPQAVSESVVLLFTSPRRPTNVF